MNIDSIWAPVVAGLGALTLAIAGPFVTGYFERKALRDERREIDQRETLHAIQDDMHALILAADSITRLGESGITAGPLVAEILQNMAPASASLIRYIERVRDEDTRNTLSGFHASVVDTLKKPPDGNYQGAFLMAFVGYGEAQKAVGKALRKL